MCCNESSDEGDTNGDDEDSDYQNDGDCDGPTVGQSPNDTDNTFHSLAIHPTDPNTIIIGNEGNGVFKSTDAGANWSRNNEGIYYTTSTYCMYPEFYEIIFDFNDPAKVYAVTTPGPGYGTTGGFYYSNDGGETWSRSNTGLHNYALTSITQDSNNTATFYIGLDNGLSTGDTPTDNSGSNIYKSTDAGENWTGLNIGVTNNRVNNIVIDPSDSNTIYCVGFSESNEPLASDHLGFAKSTDAGETWTQINTGLTSLKNGYISIDPTNTSTLYITTWGEQGAKSYKSTDSGANWTEFGESGISNIKASPFDSNLLIGFTTTKVYTSTDAGLTWTISFDFSSFNYIFKKIEYTSNQNIIYANSNQLEVFISTDSGINFSAISGDIQTLIGH